MGLETADHISELVPTNPVGATDTKSQGDDHLRLLKEVLQNDFPNADKPFYFPKSTTKTADYVVLASDENSLIVVDATAAPVTITLPTLTADDNGWKVAIIRKDATANALLVAGTISGVVNYVLERQYEYVLYTWTGTEWVSSIPESPVQFRVVAKVASAVLTRLEMRSIVLVGAAAGSSITPPAASIGDWVYIKNLTANDITFDPPGAVTVDGAATFTLDEQYEAALFVSDGTNWHVAAHFQGQFPTIPADSASKVVNFLMVPDVATPSAVENLTADEALLVDTNGLSVKHRNVNVSFNVNSVGAGGVDTAGATANAEFYLWLISNGTLVNVVGHKSNINPPTMPAGYTFKKFVGWLKTNASGQLYRTVQRGDVAMYQVGVLPLVPVLLQDGTLGTYSATTPNLAIVSWSGFAPSNAKGLLLAVTNRYQGNGPSAVLVATNNDWEGTNRGPSGSAGMVYPAWLDAAGNASQTTEIVPENSNLFYAGGGAGSALFILGWRVPL